MQRETLPLATNSSLAKRVSACAVSSILAWIAAGTAQAAVVPAALFSDNAVLQAGRELPVWGWDDPGRKVIVTLGRASVSGKADPTGRWDVRLPAMHAGETPLEMTIAGSSTVTARNILVGQVWVDSGTNRGWGQFVENPRRPTPKRENKGPQ